MEQPLVLLVFALVSFCRGQDWTPPEFCHQKQCPRYNVTEKNQEFETRLYAPTRWIVTRVNSSSYYDLLAASSRLKTYCKTYIDAGYNISLDAWPVLITVTEDQALSLSWFIPPDTIMPENTDPVVTLQSKPCSIVYVRVFGGTPSVQSGQINAKACWKALAQNCTNIPTYSGAGYDPFISFEHHNEIWFYANDICKKDN